MGRRAQRRIVVGYSILRRRCLSSICHGCWTSRSVCWLLLVKLRGQFSKVTQTDPFLSKIGLREKSREWWRTRKERERELNE